MRTDRRTSGRVAATVLAMLLAAAPAMAYRDGVGEPGVPDPGASVPGAAPVAGGRAAPGPGEVLIDFDDVTAPCAFFQTAALTDAYLARGVRFSGLPPAAGGAILNWCSNFSVTGYSGDNFLAFNAFATEPPNYYSPALPEFLAFTAPVAAVSVRVGAGDGSSAGGTAHLRAYDHVNTLVASNSIVVGPSLQLLWVSAPGIVRVEVDGPYIMVLDDLRFTLDQLVPTRPSTWARLKAAYR